MEDEIDLRDLFDVLWKRRLLFLPVFMVGVLAAGMISFAMPPSYKFSSLGVLQLFNNRSFYNPGSLHLLS